MKNTYYQDELRYLREVGPEFARVNPEIARFLGDAGSDPDVERLLEGVAFLCGRIRQKLDDELPELTANMMGLLWPHYLRPIPSMAVLELIPEIEAMQAPSEVPQNSEVASVPIDDTHCRYHTCWPVRVRPWLIEQVRLESEAARPVRLVIRFRAAAKANLDDLELNTVRFHLAGDQRSAFTLYHFLTAHTAEVSVSDGTSSSGRKTFTLNPDHVAPAGLDRAEGVIPYPVRSFAGYRLLQEYFAFKERFLFVDIKGLDRAVRKLELTDTLELTITFNHRLESYPVVSTENIRLHCVPIINLFKHSADPIRLQHDRTQYLLMPAKSGVADRRHLEIYSIDEVAGLVRTDDMKTRRYEPFYSFRHMATADPSEAAYYKAQITPNILGGDPRFGTDTYISFVSGSPGGEFPQDETISIDLSCTNRDLPDALRAGDICEPTDTSPPGLRFRNLAKPTPTIAPPLGKALHWRLISHLSLNYVSLTKPDHLKELLRVYDFQSEHDAMRALAHQRMLDGIKDVKTDYQERLVRGAAVRGVQVNLILDEDHFAGEGDTYLFATILDRFFGLYATVNAYSQMNVKFSKSGLEYEFPLRWGEQLSPAGSKWSA